ncbi:hypothetical protein ACJMK2_025153 [Sinanodonta woodiana]|uniref:RFX-type winged-helix domain-containing protein n=1 Tax=Sinanodonta woodiana TaxID=1069815 RepID=A0ABD3XJG3_SINWO
MITNRHQESVIVLEPVPEINMIKEGFMQQSNTPKMSGGADCIKSRYSTIEEGLETSISNDSSDRIMRILNEIKGLSDVEKLLLYLKLPTGAASDDTLRQTPPSCVQGSNRLEQAQAFTWIKSHLEEDPDICLPKQEVYDDYRLYCENHYLRPLCTADFGKVMKCVFPNVKARRLGQRGQSRYCYGGLRKKLDVVRPMLPELELQTPKPEDETKERDEVFSAACQLVCEWAYKLLNKTFSGIRDLAEFLLTNLYVNSKSVAAFTLIAAMQDAGHQGLKTSALFATSSNDKHRETQIQLQRKLQERELMKEQKRRLQLQKEEVEQELRQAQERSQSRLQVYDQTTPVKTPIFQRYQETAQEPAPMCGMPVLKNERESKNLIQQSPDNVKTAHFVPVLDLSIQRATTDTSPADCAAKPSDSSTTCNNQTKSNIGSNELLRRLRNQIVDEKNRTEKRHSFPFDVATERSNNKSEKENKNNKCDSEEERDLIGESSQSVLGSSGEFKPQNADHMDGSQELDNNDPAVFVKGNSECNRDIEDFSEMEVDKLDTLDKLNTVGETSSHTVSDCSIQMIETVSYVDNTLKQANTDPFCLGSYGDKQNNNGNNSQQSCSDVEDTEMTDRALKEENEDDSRWDAKPNELKIVSTNIGSSGTLYTPHPAAACRSAFVPFSQVQPRKEGISVNQNVNITKEPNQAVNYKTALQHSNPVTSESLLSCAQSIYTNSIPVIIPSYNLQKSLSSNSTQVDAVPVSNCSPLVIPATRGIATLEINPVQDRTSSHAQIQSENNGTSVPYQVTSPQSSSAQSVHSPSSIQSSPISSRNVKSRFTPIRPKASPSKTVSSMLKENRGSGNENPAYDKRPVATILKEKRAREAVIAESLAKLNLPVAQFSQSLLTTPPSQGGSFQAVPEVIHIPAKEVVIILNSSPATNAFPVPQATGVASMAKPEAKTNSAVRSKSSSNSPKMPQSYDKMEIEESPKVQSGVRGKQRKDHTIANSTEPMELQQTDDPKHRMTTLNAASPFQSESVWSFGQESPVKSNRCSMLMSSSSEDTEVIQFGRETPLKLARVGDSPLDARPQSVCSLGRETPTDLSRPDSVCSFGRETPSGGRKRKSSDISLRQNFKRLNSTGENDELVDFEFQQQHHSKGQKDEFQRRTQSCTMELDLSLLKDSGPEKEFHVLQSPDISSLERDALKDSIHITPYPLPITRQEQMQRSSVGVCVKSLRNSQQQLMKQKDDLDKRMKNFMQKESQGNNGKMNMDKDSAGTSMDIVGSSTKDGRNSSLEGLVSVHFEEQGVRIVDETLQNIQSIHSQKGTVEGNSEVHSVNTEDEYHLGVLESDLPQDVADFITETLEKQRHCLAFSEKQSLPDLVIGVENEIEIIVEQENSFMSSVCKSSGKLADDVFTVPDPLPPGQRVKDVVTSKQSPVKKDSGKSLYTGRHRSYSLPNFTPFVEAASHSIPRSSSISPQLGTDASQVRDSSASPLPHSTSPVKPFLKEQPKVIPLPYGNPQHGQNVYFQIPLEMHGKPSPSFMKSPSHSTLNQNKVPEEHLKNTPLPYLASIQHSLQKPKDVSQDKLFRKTVSLSPVLNRQNSRENSMERLNSQTPFSDPGYHSIDTSPVMNSTSMSVLLDASNTGMQSTDSANMNTNLTIHHSPQTHPHILVTSNRLSASLGSPIDPVNSSAFMPIQATSLNSEGYVTPIKPLVTLANSNSLNSEDSNLSQSPNCGSESAMNIPAGNPPPYEAAVRSLRKDVHAVDANTVQGNPVTKQTKVQVSLVRDPQRKARGMREKPGVSSANLNARDDNSIPGNPQDFGEQKEESTALLTSPLLEAYPFSFKLAQLSTKSSDDKSQSIARPTGLLATMNVSTVHGHSKDIPAKKASLHNQSEQKSVSFLHSGMVGPYPKEVGSNAANKDPYAQAHILTEKSQFKGAVSLTFSPQSSSNIPLTSSIYSNIDLPDARFMGNSPNVDISSALTAVTSSSNTDMLFPKHEYSAIRNLQFRLDEDELRTTLDDLRSLDGQYFQQGEFSPCLREEAMNEDLDLDL